jgi:methyl-accepting chemotaxis protein
VLAGEIANMAGQQGQRREAAQTALAAMVEKSTAISELISGANTRLDEIGEQMNNVVQQSDAMKNMTDNQASRSQSLMDITDQSAQASKATVEGASTVVEITGELEKLSNALNEQVGQFKLSGTDNR